MFAMGPEFNRICLVAGGGSYGEQRPICRGKPLGLKTELELRFANRLVPVLVRIMIQNGNSG